MVVTSAAITLDMLRGASSAEFPVIDLDYPIVCLPTCRSADNPPKYPPITYGEYRVWWLNTNYGAKLKAASV